jgi:ceramide glucosyltransferase
MTIIEFFEVILGLLVIMGAVYWIIALQTALRFFRPAEPRTDLCLESVSILKPIKGKDFQLEENIRSFCEQDFPEHEVVLGLNRPDGNEILETKRISESISSDKVKLVISDRELGANCKISNL